MSTSWYPAQNPGGQNRSTTRNALASHIMAQRIPGLVAVLASRSADVRWDSYPGGDPDFKAIAKITGYDASEDREAYTGATDAGGKLAHYAVTLTVFHQSYESDNDQNGSAEDDYDRTIDGIIDALRGTGRDLGRPDVVLMVGEWPRAAGIRVRSNPPLQTDNGGWIRTGLIMFNITQYIAPST
jgi:hypothetical protein